MRLLQMIVQARQTARRISDQSAGMAANSSFLSWFSTNPGNFSGREMDETGECVKKTHEFLDKALDFVCEIFRVSPSSVMNAVL